MFLPAVCRLLNIVSHLSLIVVGVTAQIGGTPAVCGSLKWVSAYVPQCQLLEIQISEYGTYNSRTELPIRRSTH